MVSDRNWALPTGAEDVAAAKAAVYYESGPYFDTIRDAAIKGHSVLPYSSVSHRFYGAAPGSGLFETKDRAECQERFLRELFMATARNE
jgi:hypothetical protein